MGKQQGATRKRGPHWKPPKRPREQPAAEDDRLDRRIWDALYVAEQYRQAGPVPRYAGNERAV